MITHKNMTSFLGVTWGLIPISYLVPGGQLIMHGMHVVLYVSMALLIKQSKIPKDSVAIFAIGLIFLTQSLLLDAHGTFELNKYLSLILFSVSLASLLALIERDTIQKFSSNFFITSSFCAAFHVLLVYAGQISNHYGRLNFIGNEHPNLGGEIFSIAAFAGAISMNKKSFFLLCLPMLYSTIIMETRTGTVVIALTIVAKVFLETRGKITNLSLISGFLLGVLLLVLALLEGTLTNLIATKVLLSEDTGRGAATGYVSGRNYQWAAAWNNFVERPWFGWGMGLYSRGQSGAHNPLLYSLSMFGIVGLLFWLWLGNGFFKLIKSDVRLIILIFPVSLMMVLNDRFINSNSFPILYYFFVIQLGRFAPNKWEMADFKFFKTSKFRFYKRNRV